MPRALSAVVVSYRSASCARRAIASLETSAAAAGLPLETIAVVNSGDEGERAELERVASRVVFPGRNLGYAGGLNAGIAAATGDLLALANPDIEVAETAIGALADAAAARGTAAGPAFYLDGDRAFLVPPFEEPHPLALARRRLSRDAARRERPFRRLLRRALAWSDDVARGRVVEASALPGALLVLSRDTLRRAGPFDEGYPLYYEENEWQRRLRVLGGRLVRVGSAPVVHVYGSATRQEPRAAEWFERSERRFFEAHFGDRGGAALEALAATANGVPEPRPLGDGLELPEVARPAVGVSPERSFVPFGLALLAPSRMPWRPPSSLAATLGGARWYARSFDASTGVLYDEAAIT